jgi:hypothetical protein
MPLDLTSQYILPPASTKSWVLLRSEGKLAFEKYGKSLKKDLLSQGRISL